MRVHRFMGCFPKTRMLPRHTSLRPFSACALPMTHRVPRDPTRLMDPRRGPGTMSTPPPAPSPQCTHGPESLLFSENAFFPHASVLFPALFPDEGDPHLHGLSDDIDPLSKSSSDTPTLAGRGRGRGGQATLLSELQRGLDGI